jgi:hypothetical protein
MTRKKETPAPGTTEPVITELSQAATQLAEIDDERANLSAQKRAIFERLQAEHACNRHAIKAAIQYAQLSEEKRENWDWTYEQTRLALGCPLQPDLFDQAFAEKVTAAADANQTKH